MKDVHPPPTPLMVWLVRALEVYNTAAAFSNSQQVQDSLGMWIFFCYISDDGFYCSQSSLARQNMSLVSIPSDRQQATALSCDLGDLDLPPLMRSEEDTVYDIIGASMSEPHTSGFNAGFSLLLMCVVDVSYVISKIAINISIYIGLYNVYAQQRKHPRLLRRGCPGYSR